MVSEECVNVNRGTDETVVLCMLYVVLEEAKLIIEFGDPLFSTLQNTQYMNCQYVPVVL